MLLIYSTKPHENLLHLFYCTFKHKFIIILKICDYRLYYFKLWNFLDV